jgi:raffinose/stachyose/melibiose transport system substrate-binding protein
MAEPKARQRSPLRAGAIALAASLALACGASNALPARNAGTITLTMLANVNKQPAYDVLIPNFERVYPNIRIEISYAASLADASQIESVELAAGNAPDLLFTTPGSGSPISVASLASAGDLAPMVNASWVKWSLPSIISADKYGRVLYSFTPAISPVGIFTNDDLFKWLGLRVPQTFAQLLDVCQKAKAAGAVAVIIPGETTSSVMAFVTGLAVATVYEKDRHWATEQRAGTVTFESSVGWHEALQQFVDMNDAGCFQPGAAGTTLNAALAQFAQGQGMMFPGITGSKGVIDAANPQFKFSHHPYPGGSDPSEVPVAEAAVLGVHVGRCRTAGLGQVRAEPKLLLVESERRARTGVERDRPAHRAAHDRRRPQRDGRGVEAGAGIAP